MVIKKTTNSKSILQKSRIYHCSFMCMPSSMVKKGVGKVGLESRQSNYYSL